MKIAITGGTGFIGRHIINQLAAEGHQLRCWYRNPAGRFAPVRGSVEWIAGELSAADTMKELVAGCDAVVHSALWKPGDRFRGGEGHLPDFIQRNVGGTIQLVEAAIQAECPRFVYLSSCAVHEIILDDRPLDETHPLWATSHYGAHKAAVEQFVHSYGKGQGYNICAVRPTGVYGLATPAPASKWFELVEAVTAGKEVTVSGGGKEVHVADVAGAVSLLLGCEPEKISGEAFNCYDRYVSRYEVASLARQLSGSDSIVHGQPRRPRHEICTDKIRELGMTFGGETRLRETIGQLVQAVQETAE